MIKAKDLKAGMTFWYANGMVKHAYQVEVFESLNVVMVLVNPETPFISSSFASFNPEELVKAKWEAGKGK